MGKFYEQDLYESLDEQHAFNESLKQHQKDEYEQKMIASMGREIWNRVEEKFYPPSESYEFHDPIGNFWYNKSGQMLRDPSEYDTSNPEWSPFGDE